MNRKDAPVVSTCFLILWSEIVIPMLPLVVILLVPGVLRNFRKSALLAPLGVVAGIELALTTAGTVD